MSAFLFTVAVLAASIASAPGDVYVVMQTDAPASAPAVAIHDDIRTALTSRSVNVKLAPTAQELRRGLQAAACNSSADVCAVAVGRALGGTHVIASRLDNVDGGFTLELALHELGAGTIVRRTQKSASVDDLRNWARIEALTFAKQALRGTLLVTDLPADAVVVIDGTDVVTLPMSAPLPLSVGAHQLEARINDGPVYTQHVSIEAEHTATVRLCAAGAAVGPCTQPGPVVVDSGPHPLLVAGVAGMVVGAMGIGFGVAANIYANTAHPDLTDPVAAFATAKAASLSGYIVGGAVLVTGIVAVAVAVVSE